MSATVLFKQNGRKDRSRSRSPATAVPHDAKFAQQFMRQKSSSNLPVPKCAPCPVPECKTLPSVPEFRLPGSTSTATATDASVPTNATSSGEPNPENNTTQQAGALGPVDGLWINPNTTKRLQTGQYQNTQMFPTIRIVKESEDRGTNTLPPGTNTLRVIANRFEDRTFVLGDHVRPQYLVQSPEVASMTCNFDKASLADPADKRTRGYEQADQIPPRTNIT